MQAADSLAADSVSADSLAVTPLDVSDAAVGLVGKVEGWVDALVLLLPNVVVALVVVVAAAFAARLARRVVTGVMRRVTAHAPAALNVVNLLATLASLAVLAAGLFAALRIVGLDGFVTTLLAGAGIVGLALGFAFQDIASNFIAGVLMAVRNPFVVGQTIETGQFMGVVQEISLRSTVLDTFAGQRVILPNARVFGDAIVNYSARGQRRVDLTVGVGYGDDLGTVERVARDALDALPMRRPERPAEVFFTGFGDSSVLLTARVWTDFGSQAGFLAAQSAAVRAVKAAFDAAGITIPFPVRTLDIDAGALREALAGRSGPV